MKTISLVTTCMNRLSDLAQTLPDNLTHADRPWVERVLLDYGSVDRLGDWVRANLAGHLASGLLVYLRAEASHYSMPHSRNVAMLAARGDTVHNVDADNRTGKGFVEWLSYAMQQHPRRTAFAKSPRLMRGRLGFYQRDFILELGGYDESFLGYGWDDFDLHRRAQALGFESVYFGGQYIDRIKTPRELKTVNMPPEARNARGTEKSNRAISEANIAAGRLRANRDRVWGAATLVRNFDAPLCVGSNLL